jgi:DNA-binding transcriptional regulator YdaS (Cro superfamily)
MRASARPRSELAPHIERAIEICGGRQEDLAAAMAVPQQLVSKLIYGDVPMSAEYALSIHRATDGVVPASALRPDLWSRPEHVPSPSIVPDQSEAVSESAS